MSNSLAIAAVTATIRNILNLAAHPLPLDPDPDTDLNDVTCTTRPPDKARTSEGQNQLNLFLYQPTWNAALRNADIAGQVRPNETAMTPVALSLYYLVTAYGKNNEDLLAHRVLGRAMSLLHDRAVLIPSEIQGALPGADLSRQVERIRIVPHALSGEELSKLWAVFQTPYRVSASYEVSVVLIDSMRRAKAAPPVVSRGLVALTGVITPYPELAAITFPTATQRAARIPAPALAAPPAPAVPAAAGDVITLAGHDLSGAAIAARFARSLLAAPIELAPLAGSSSTALRIGFPADHSLMPAGLYQVTARVTPGAIPAQARTTNVLALAIAPRIRRTTTAPRTADGVLASVWVSPQVWPEQRASLLVGDIEVVAEPHPTKTDLVRFVVPLPAGSYSIRLRVDGVDSFLVDHTATPPAYDPSQILVLP
ncbi:MAG TPA: DUF4255 domain-containing protein [Kofleriaceae bacterium]|nr:DUF4255 domain-containing protein [Kofleriaceae bacterium]